MRRISLRGILMLTAAMMTAVMALMVVLYFYLFSSVAEAQVQDSFESLADSVEARLEDSIVGIDEAAKNCAYSNDVQSITFFSDPEEYFRAAPPTEDIIGFIMNGNPNISAIFIRDKNGRSFSTDVSKKRMFHRALEQYWPDANYNFQEPFFSTLLYSDGGAKTPYVFYFCPFYNVRTGEFEREDSAVCAILCNVDYLVNWMAIDKSDQSAMAVIYEGSVISSSRPLSEAEYAAMHRLEDGRGSVRIGGRRFLSNSVLLPQFGWRFAYIVPRNELLGDMEHMRNLSFLLLLGASLILVGLALWTALLITRPVRQIVGDMRAVRAGERTHVRSTNVYELQELAGGINQTLDSIESSHRKESEAQRKLHQAVVEQHRAQLQAYQNQVNPHFLFNTLECMRSMARHYSAGPLEQMIRSLSRMFRYSLHSNLIVPLREEVGHLKDYVDIMRQRMREGCDLRVRVEDAAQNRSVPAMCLQPIVENCIAHAFADQKNRPCMIEIQGWLSEPDGVLIVRISDNGCGIEPNRLDALREDLARGERDGEKPVGIGLHNISRRMRLLFGERSGMGIASKLGFYTVVELRVPREPEGLLNIHLPVSDDSSTNG